MTLESEDVKAIACRVEELLGDLRVDRRLLDVVELAARLGVTRSWVYAHSRELHAIRLGKGPRARLRFDLPTALEALAAEESVPLARGPRRLRSRKPRIGSDLDLIQGRSARRPLGSVD